MSEMICVCSDEGEAEARAARLAMCARLGVPPEKLAPTVLLSIAWHFGADLVVYADQWFGVAVRLGEWRADIECDLPLDGMIYLWNKLAEQFPLLAPPAPDPPQNYEMAVDPVDHDDLWTAHRKSCPTCEKVKKCEEFCPQGATLWNNAVAAGERALSQWGMPDYDDAPSYWGHEPEAAT